MPSTTTAEKAALRRALRRRADELSPAQRRSSDEALFARLTALPQWRQADLLLLFHGMGSEPDTARLLPALWAAGRTVGLPRCLPGHGMEFRAVGPDTPLRRHPFGMLEPDEACPLLVPTARSLALVPGVSFDPSGGRLGQGGGYYDRWLAGYPGRTVGLCRACLLSESLALETHDRRVDLVVTEDGLYGPSQSHTTQSGAPGPRSVPECT
ncbi:5-formyltetrahydrofolate cyclo-ligase [Flavonifractor hominis]|uniref:5-formyltetrahydrofolate cyclo-ligase n=1 Tax=Flavonifractor hominis TaxID=3133178 RepID=A0ABV1ES17_9FIRM